MIRSIQPLERPKLLHLSVQESLKAYIADLEKQMQKAAPDLDFEIAAAGRDQIRRLEADELGLPPDQRAAPVKGRSMGGAPGTRTTRFAKMNQKSSKRFGGAQR